MHLMRIKLTDLPRITYNYSDTEEAVRFALSNLFNACQVSSAQFVMATALISTAWSVPQCWAVRAGRNSGARQTHLQLAAYIRSGHVSTRC